MNAKPEGAKQPNRPTGPGGANASAKHEARRSKATENASTKHNKDQWSEATKNVSAKREDRGSEATENANAKHKA